MLWALSGIGSIFAYMAAEAARRGPYFIAQFAVVALLWIGALAGILRGLF